MQNVNQDTVQIKSRQGNIFSNTIGLPQKSHAGFTLIEVVVVFFILVIVVGIVVALFQPIILAPESSLRLRALYLAQEGVEITRNIRDNNFANIAKGENVEWLAGLDACDQGSGGCEADWQSTSLAANTASTLWIVQGLYKYGGNAGAGDIPTTFQRNIVVLPEGGDPVTATKADVEVEVFWQHKGRTHSVKIATEMHKWLEFE